MFNKKFIYDSYSSRTEKGIHKAHERFKKFAWKLSRNNTQTVWVLKCDIRKFFDSIDHNQLLKIISKTIDDSKVLDLIKSILESYSTTHGKGIPNKIITRKFNQGIDFLGYIIFPHLTLLRTRTKRRMLKNIKILKMKYNNKEISEKTFNASLASYFGILTHCRGFKIKTQILKICSKLNKSML